MLLYLILITQCYCHIASHLSLLKLDLCIPSQEIVVFVQIQMIEVVGPVEPGSYGHTRRIEINVAPRTIPLSHCKSRVDHIDSVHCDKVGVSPLFKMGTLRSLNVADKDIICQEVDIV